MEKKMTDTVTVGQELQGQILDTVRKSQDMALEAIRTWTDAIQPVTSAMPPVTLPLDTISNAPFTMRREGVLMVVATRGRRLFKTRLEPLLTIQNWLAGPA